MLNNFDINNADFSDLEFLSKLDSEGLFLAPNEGVEDYRKRLKRLESSILQIEEDLSRSGSFKLEDICSVCVEDRIGVDFIYEAGEITRSEYGFAINWIPGFFMSKSLGPLWGGCAIMLPENNFAIFLVRSAFRKRRKWLFYRRDELLSHELCHVARMPIADRIYDENFAYRLSPSRLRRFLGGAFRSEFDAIIFIAPIFLLIAVQFLKLFLWDWIPIFPFWVLALVCPAYLLLRNFFASYRLAKAVKAMKSAGFKDPYAALFRCSSDEIEQIAKLASITDLLSFLNEKKEKELRWRIIFHRFHGEMK